MVVKGSMVLWVMGAVIISVYFKTLAPSIAGGDSGEIVAEGCELGVAHPPGYPLLTILIHFISEAVPIDLSIAKCVNVMSAVFTTFAAIFMGHTVCKLSHSSSRVFGALLTMGMFAFSPLIWQYAVTAEVFPLNTLFAALLILLVVDFSKERKPSTALFGAFLCGIAACNQHTIILFEIPLILWMLFLLRNYILVHPLFFVQLSSAFLLGIAPYAYLPLSELFNPQRGSWGHVTTLDGFIHHFLRRDYGTFTLFSGSAGKQAEGLWERNEAYWKDVTEVQGVAFAQWFAVTGVLVSVLFGIGVLDSTFHSSTTALSAAVAPAQTATSRPTYASIAAKKAAAATSSSAKKTLKKSAENSSSNLPKSIPESSMSSHVASISDFEAGFTPFVLVLTQIFYFAFFHSLANLPLSDRLLYGVHQRFWMQPNILYFIWVGLGFNFVSSILQTISAKFAPFPRAMQVGSVSLQVLTALVAIVICQRQCQRWYTISDQSDQSFFQQYAQAVLSPLPAKAVLMINYDQQWTSVRYVQVCEGFHNQVVTMHLSLMTYPWFHHKTPLYAHQENITFPGTYLAAPNSRAVKENHAFTMLQFLDANSPHHRIYIGGKFTHGDPEVAQKYDVVPVGLVSQLLSVRQLPSATQYSALAIAAWQRVLSFLPRLPHVSKYPEETWEWTIGRDFKDRLTDTAAYLLDRAIKEESEVVQPLIDATYWLETAYLLDGPEVAPASLLKNMGLAHVHLLQNAKLKDANTLGLPTKDIFNSTTAIGWPLNQT